MGFDMQGAINVSTHSRPKAAGYQKALYMIINECFNTQPPEGGWLCWNFYLTRGQKVSTHSRPKAAGTRTCAR